MRRAVWLVAGTSEGRRLAEELADLGVHVYVTVATEYGASLFPENGNITVVPGRMTLEDMCGFIRKYQPELVLDSSHPYAVVVTETVREACRQTNCEYMRMLRPATPHDADCVMVDDFGEAMEVLSHTEGPIFLTTGSKNLVDFTRLPDYAERITCRILPLRDSLDNALTLGYKPGQIICMQGPFSRELNVAMFRQCGARFVVSKDTGKAGGFEEKVAAAREVGARLILIRRNPEEGADMAAVIGKLRQRFSDEGK